MIDPMNAAKTTAQPGPVKPIPTIIPSPIRYQVVGEEGRRTLWVVFALMLISSACFAGLSWRIPVRRRLLHSAITLATIVGTLSYFAMATGQGNTIRCTGFQHHHHHHHHHHGDHGHPLESPPAGGVCRQVFWARYVDWAVSTPLLLLALCAMAGVDGAHTLMAIAADIIMKLAGLFSALGRRHAAQRWGWYVVAWVAYLFVIWHVAVHGSRTARAKGTSVARAFGTVALFALVLWTIYPIIWALASSHRIMDVDSEILTYAILDVLAKAGAGLWLLTNASRVPEANPELDGYWSNGLDAEGRIRIGEDDEGA